MEMRKFFEKHFRFVGSKNPFIRGYLISQALSSSNALFKLRDYTTVW